MKEQTTTKNVIVFMCNVLSIWGIERKIKHPCICLEISQTLLIVGYGTLKAPRRTPGKMGVFQAEAARKKMHGGRSHRSHPRDSRA